ncbi:MAG TPA: PrsW family glutamic-type intramembrane protease [Tepidiformaceae bacterium]|nr:PrsW family glutamic-type intramembrane protease [Tepidiformaceae bacterium]HMO95296.1 PrsW family glutamic-type intramembrane protease [Tepidiformaceae bacterium]
MVGGAVVVGAVAFINGLVALTLLVAADGTPREKLFEINIFLGTAIVTVSLGGVLVYHAASSLGGSGSSAIRLRARWRWLVIPMLTAFPALIAAGQWQVNHPERMPYLFPLTNVAIVSIPSLVIAVVVTQRYLQHNRWAWPVSWREWTSAFIYGAVGATSIAALINTAYVILGAAWLIETRGWGDRWDPGNLPSIPRALGIAFDLSVLSIVAPINEEFWKGMLVAFFFFRKGGAARCFAWGVLAGAGFNLLETFQNSLVIVNPDAVSQQQLREQWWLFAVARAGTGALHAASSGLAALGFYGLFRREWRFVPLFLCGVLLHALWNFMNFTLSGDAFLSQAGPDSRLLDILSVAGLVGLFGVAAAVLWEAPRRVQDRRPAPIYQVLGMVPSERGAAPS